MTGFEPLISGIGNDRSSNWATTTAQCFCILYDYIEIDGHDEAPAHSQYFNANHEHWAQLSSRRRWATRVMFKHVWNVNTNVLHTFLYVISLHLDQNKSSSSSTKELHIIEVVEASDTLTTLDRPLAQSLLILTHKCTYPIQYFELEYILPDSQVTSCSSSKLQFV